MENAQTAATSTNQGRWKPNLTQAGRYKVEAFIAAHGTFSKACSAGNNKPRPESSEAGFYHRRTSFKRVAAILPSDSTRSEQSSLAASTLM